MIKHIKEILEDIDMEYHIFISRIHSKIDNKLTHIRFRKHKYTHMPFYDRSKGVYRIFFNDGYDEEGDIDYIVSEYIGDCRIYHFTINGNRDHEHDFAGVLADIAYCKGKGFSIEGFEEEYSKQEIRIIEKYLNKLKEDLR